jgi:SNF2 family DNA or RNA helicase
MRQYAAMAKEMYLSIQGAGIEAHNAASKTIKCLQLASGAIYTDDKGSWSEIHDEKLQALESVIEEAAGASVLVAYHFKSDLERLQKRFPKGRVLDSNPQTIKAWNEGQIELLFAHPASAGHGLNLQDGGNILVVFSHWWDLEQFQQMVERIGPMRQKQSGHERPVFIHHIVAAGTVDELVMKRRETKREVQDLLLEALKYEVAP